MKAPIQNFYKEIVDHENEVYVCNHQIDNQPCATQLFRSLYIESYILDDPSYICVQDDNTINTYDKPKKKARYLHSDAQSAGKVATTSGELSLHAPSMICEDIEVCCRNCDGFLGYRNTTKIQFQFQQLTEIHITDDDHCVAEYPLETKTSSQRQRR